MIRLISNSNEDEKIYNTILRSLTRTRTTITTISIVSPEPLTFQHTRPLLWTSPEKLRPWHQSHEAMTYKFTVPSELAQDQEKDSEARILLGDDVFEEFPALRYCIENLPEHVRLVESTNIPFHRSFAAFLHSKFGTNWIDSFWAIRDPEQAYGRQHAVHFASALGLQPEIKSLLASGISVDDRDQYGNTALDVATSTGIVDTIRLLYEIGRANVHARQMASLDRPDPILQQHNNVLHTAVWYGHKDATVYLLKAGAETLVPDLKGLTVLDIAVEAGNSPLVKLLVDKPSTLGVVHFAAKRGRLETLKLLIEKENVDPCIKAWQGDTPLHVAAQHNQVACVQYLAPITPEHVYNRDGLHAFHVAAKSGTSEVLEVFISRQLSDINAVDRNGRSALYHACLAGKAAAVACLTRMGIDTTLVDTKGYTALELLLTGEQMECSDQQRREVMMVFQDPRTREKRPTKGGNLLHVAFEASPPKRYVYRRESMQPEEHGVIEILLEWGLDPCETNSSGSTALHLAAVWGDKRFLRLSELCDCVNIQDHLGQTPLHVLLSTNSSRVSPADIKILLDKGTNLELRDHKGRTAVHHAMHQPKEVFDSIIGQGKAVNLQDDEGRTPLHILVDDSARDILSLSKLLGLIERGADIHITNKHKKTALDTYIWNLMKDARCVGHDNILTTFAKHNCGLGDYSKAMRVTLLGKLVIKRAVDDGSLVLASLRPVTLDVPPEASADSPIDVTGIDPELLFKDVSENGKAEILRFLISNGASDDQILPFFQLLDETYLPSIQMRRSERFMGEWRLTVRRAAERGHASTVALIRDAVLKAVVTDDLPALRSFVEDFGWSAEVVDPGNRTMLSLAAERGNTDMIRYLLRKNVPTELLDIFERTALYWAAKSGQLDVVKILVEHGATPTKHAVDVGAIYGHEAITEYLQEYATSSNRN